MEIPAPDCRENEDVHDAMHGVLVFHEKMTSRQWLGLALVTVAMIILNT